MEFYEFVKEAGGPKVDLVISTTTERQPRNQMQTKPRKSGGFYGFTNDPKSCFSGQRGSLPPPQQQWLPEDLRWEVTYSGSCDGGVAAVDHRCAVLADSSSRDFVDLVLVAMREGARSVLLKAADSVSPPAKDEMDALGLRQAMLFAPTIRDAGERPGLRIL
ncbi:POFUT2 [Symbiodinium sp. KB8]|nr:POFUT2 [Symbiodinium sp. KB8]